MIIQPQMNYKNILPQHKSDVERAEQLKHYSSLSLKPIIPDLLEWLQDLNWPVAEPVADYLKSIHEEITEEILAVLSTDDNIWKYWIIETFGPITTSKELIAVIERIAYMPTINEANEELHKIALDVLQRRLTTP